MSEDQVFPVSDDWAQRAWPIPPNIKKCTIVRSKIRTDFGPITEYA